MASSLGGAATTEYLTYTFMSAFTTVTTTDTSPAAEYAPYSTVFVTGSPFNTLYGPPIETLILSTAYTSTVNAVGSPAFSSPTTNTNSTFEPYTSTSIVSAGLSSGAKAGVGVGVAVGFVIFAAFIAWCLIVRRRRRRESPLSEVASPAHEAGYHKPELDATVMPKPSDRGLAGGRPGKPELEANLAKQSPVGVQANGVELDDASKWRTDGRAELDGRMVPKSGKIT